MIVAFSLVASSFETAALRPPQSLTQNAVNRTGLSGKLVMPGLVPGIHVLVALKHRKTWMAGTSPAMTKKANRFQGVRKVRKCWLHFRSDSQDEV